MGCDDMCDLSLGDTAGQKTPVTKLLDDINWSEYRRTSIATNSADTRISAWVSLTADSEYYIEGDLLNSGGGAWYNVGVEIEQASVNANHPRNVKEVQRLAFEQDDVRETHTITVTNLQENDTGTFRIKFTGTDLKPSVSETLKVSMSANELRDGIKKYWEDNGLKIVVTKKGYDSSDVETTTTADIVKYIFEIKLDRMVSTASTSAMIVTGITTNANIAFVRNSVDSAPPMTGKWKI
jgi:hypothetical protein